MELLFLDSYANYQMEKGVPVARERGGPVHRHRSRGIPKYSSALADMVAQPRAATVMGLLEEARLARLRGFKVAQKSGSMKTAFGRFKDFIVGNF